MPSALMRWIAREQVVHHQRRQAERRLVEQQQLRPRHQRARDRHHLAAGRPTARRPDLRASPSSTGNSSSARVERRRAAARAHAAGRLPSSRFSRTLIAGEQAPPFGHERDAGSAQKRCGGSRVMSRPSSDDACRCARAACPAIALISVVLPAPLGPTTTEQLAALHVERHAPQRRRGAVGHLRDQ